MSVRVYLHKKDPNSKQPMFEFTQAIAEFRRIWGDRVQYGVCSVNRLAVWIEFDTEEEAALFKLTEL